MDRPLCTPDAMLEDIPTPALLNVFAWLRTPSVVGRTCKLFHNLVNSDGCQTLWLQRHLNDIGPRSRLPVYALLTFKPLASREPESLVRILLNVLSDSSSCKGATDRAKAALASGDWLAALQTLVPNHELHLLQYVVLGGHVEIAEELLLRRTSSSQEPTSQPPAPCQLIKHAVDEMQIFTAALTAASAGHASMLQLLLEHLQNQQTQHPCSIALVEAACKGGSIPCIRSCLSFMEQQDPQPPTAHWLYTLPAAALSGSAEATQYMLHFLSGQMSIELTSQLPAALVNAGQEGHRQCVGVLLNNEAMSQRPLEVRQNCAYCLLDVLQRQRNSKWVVPEAGWWMLNILHPSQVE